MVLIPFLAGLLFGRRHPRGRPGRKSLNPLFGGSAFRTWEQARDHFRAAVLIPFLAGLLFGRGRRQKGGPMVVLIPFLAGLLFGPVVRFDDDGAAWS